MPKREKLSEEIIAVFTASHPGWRALSFALEKTFPFSTYADSIAFVVRLGFAAEKRDHHPDMHIGFCSVKVAWSTHDVGGITTLDTEMAELSEQLYKG